MTATSKPISPQPRRSDQTSQNETSTLEQVREQARTIAADLGDLGSLAKDAALETVDSARQRVVAAGEQGKMKAGDLEDRLLEYVSKRPLKSILIAAGAGALLGAMLRR